MNPLITFAKVKTDCVHYKGDVPCRPHKAKRYVCQCPEYRQVKSRILIIKLGALGDVIRTTPLLRRLHEEYEGAQITWITNAPDLIPQSWVHEVYTMNFETVFKIQNRDFDIAINLDKDQEAAMLLASTRATKKYGFTWDGLKVVGTNDAANRKILTGLFDDISKQNRLSYPEEIFSICDLEYQGEEYVLELDDDLVEKWSLRFASSPQGLRVGLNTGCGKRWLTRLWPKRYWVRLIEGLTAKGLHPVLIGGPDEDKLNRELRDRTGARYEGTMSLKEFSAQCSQLDVIVSAVSLVMHVAIGLQKNLILFNNIFNAHEFELFGRGEILEPTGGCDCYFGTTCKRQIHCMDNLTPETVLKAVMKYVEFEPGQDSITELGMFVGTD